MKTLTILILVLFSVAAFGEENFRCTDESSSIQGNTFYSCGLGEGMTEGVGRDRALIRAVNEFNSLCSISTDCPKKVHRVDPGKTSCDQLAKYHFKCYRLIIVTVE